MNWTYGQTGKNQTSQGRGKGSGKGFGKDGGKDSGKGMMGGGAQAHSNVFVGNLPENMTQGALEEAFRTHGAIESCSVMNKAGRTFGFVKYQHVSSASRAIAALDGKAGWLVKYANNDSSSKGGKGGKDGYGKAGGWGANVKHSNVFVGDLQEGTTETNLREVFSPHGQIKSCI